MNSMYGEEAATHLLDLAQQPSLALLPRLGAVVPRSEAGELDQVDLHDIRGELWVVVGRGVSVCGGVLGWRGVTYEEKRDATRV